MTKTRQIPLSRGLFATVDAADYDWLMQWKWSVTMMGKGDQKKPYAIRVEWIKGGKGKQRSILMHRAIMTPESGEVVDHIDRDGLNNTRANMRVCTQGKNMLNRVGNQTGRKTSKFKGVYWQKDIGRWRARFRLSYLGTFTNEVDAAMAYDCAVREHDPEFGYFNFPDGGDLSLAS